MTTGSGEVHRTLVFGSAGHCRTLPQACKQGGEPAPDSEDLELADSGVGMGNPDYILLWVFSWGGHHE